MKRVKIREGNSGILYYSVDGKTENTYIPDCDLPAANRLLSEFSHVKDKDGNLFKDIFNEMGINWYPTVISFLFCRIFYPYVKYKKFLIQFPLNEYSYIFEKGLTRLEFLVNLFNRVMRNSLSKKILRIKQLTGLFLRRLYNWKILKFHSNKKLIFYRYGVNDFRTNDLKQTLDDIGIDYLQAVEIGRRIFVKNMFSPVPKPILMINISKISGSYNLDSFVLPEFLDKYDKLIFQKSIQAVFNKIASFKNDFLEYKKMLAKSKAKVFYGIDDANDIYPILYACRENGIRTIGHQHGACYIPYLAAYSMEGIKEGEYRWFDHVLVWGEYWKDLAYKIAACYPEGFFRVGANKKTYFPKDESACGIKGAKNILVPYEFLANTYKIGKYIIALQNMGYTIFFKARPDEEIEKQLECYCLPEKNKKQLIILTQINDEIMKNIDITAGTSTTLLYDLIPYRKDIWILDTELKMLDHMIDHGLAKKIRLKYIEEDIAAKGPEITPQTVNYIVSKNPLTDVLRKEFSLLL